MPRKTDKKTSTPAEVPVAVTKAPTPPAPVKNDADVMWDQIKDLPIEMFALPNQVVAMHCTPVPVDPTKLYLVLRSSAVLPSLEESLKRNFTVEMVDKWAVVTRVRPPLPPKK